MRELYAKKKIKKKLPAAVNENGFPAEIKKKRADSIRKL